MLRLHIHAAKLFSTEIIPIYVFRSNICYTCDSLPTIVQLPLGGLKNIAENRHVEKLVSFNSHSLEYK